MSAFRYFARDDRGSVAILFAFVIMAITVAAGMGVDYGRGLALKANMQQALDGAVLAGVSSATDKAARARAFFDAGMAEAGGENVKATFSVVGENKLSGQASADIRMTLTGLLGVKTMKVATKAMAEASGGGSVCVLALSKTASQQILVNSGARIDAPECEVHGKSKASPAAIFNAGTSLKTKRICLAGTSIIDNGGEHPNLSTGCGAAEDPFAGTLPQPASSVCTYNNLNYNGGNVTMSPGVYCGWINLNNSPNVTFQPGVYILKNGGWNVNGGTWSGNGVTFFFADQSKIQFNSAVAVNLTPPSSGTYANLMMYEAPGLSQSQFIFNDAKDMQLKGLIYLPSRDVTFNSGSQMTSKSFTLVVNSLILNSTVWKLAPSVPVVGGSGGNKSARLTQ